MQINDEVYGKSILKESVLEELIFSNYISRLKGVSQFGMPSEYYHKKGFSRYEHSIGVMILLRKLGAELKEQISGLLHDGSHTAFSHVIDWTLGDPTKEDYQDKNHLNSIKNSEIPKILSKHNIDYREISQIENFFLLEREAPDLCADRIDYSLRELKTEGKNLNNIIQNLEVFQNEIVFKDFESAEYFAKEYMRLQSEHWGGSEARARYYLLSDILKKAIDRKILSLEDIWKGEDYDLIAKIRAKDLNLSKKLDMLKNGFKISETKNQGIFLEKKFRFVDPKILNGNQLKKLSELSEDYCSLLEKEKANSKIKKRVLINGH